MVEHSFADPKVPGSILCPVSCRGNGPQLPKGCGCIGFLYAQKDPIQKEKGATPRILVSTIDGSTLPQNCLDE